MSEHAAGQTLAMVKILPKPCVVVVHSAEFALYVRRMIIDVRGAAFFRDVKIAVCSDRQGAAAALIGRQTPVFVDHAYPDQVSPDLLAYVMRLAESANYLSPEPIQ